MNATTEELEQENRLLRAHNARLRRDLEERGRPTIPAWINYDHTTGVLTIHGRKYAAALFGEGGFLAPAGTVLRIENGPGDVVTVTTMQGGPEGMA